MSRLPRSSVAAVVATIATSVIVATPTIALAAKGGGGGGGGGGGSTSGSPSTSSSSSSPSSSTSSPGGSGTPAVAPVYAGRAYGLQVAATALAKSVKLGPVFVSDTGELPSAGGSLIQQLATVNVPLGGVSVNADIVNGVTAGDSGTTDSSAETVGLVASVDGLLNVNAGVLQSDAKAVCPAQQTTTTTPTFSGAANLANLKITLLGVPVSIPLNPQPNTTINLLGVVTIILNEQTMVNGRLNVNALHIEVNGAISSLLSTVATANIVVSHADAGVTCGKLASGGGSTSGSPSPSDSSSTPPPPPACTGHDFMTGGGQIVDSNGKILVSFGFVGGDWGGTLKGHFNAVDKNTSPNTKYDGKGVTSYLSTGATSRKITYTTANGPLVVDVADNSTPGTLDTIAFANYSGNVSGNIDLHQAGVCPVPTAAG